MGDTHILFSTHIFVSSLINKAIYKGLAAFTGIPFFGEAHFRHLNQPDLYIETVEGAFDPSCKRRRPGKGKNPPKTLKQLDLRPNQPKITGQTGHKYGRNRAKITGKIRPKTQAKSSQKHGRTLAKNTDQRGLNTCQKTQKISYARRLRPTLMLRGYRKESH